MCLFLQKREHFLTLNWGYFEYNNIDNPPCPDLRACRIISSFRCLSNFCLSSADLEKRPPLTSTLSDSLRPCSAAAPDPCWSPGAALACVGARSMAWGRNADKICDGSPHPAWQVNPTITTLLTFNPKLTDLRRERHLDATLQDVVSGDLYGAGQLQILHHQVWGHLREHLLDLMGLMTSKAKMAIEKGLRERFMVI